MASYPSFWVTQSNVPEVIEYTNRQNLHLDSFKVILYGLYHRIHQHQFPPFWGKYVYLSKHRLESQIQVLPSLNLTWPLKIGGWKMNFLTWGPDSLFSGASCHLSFRKFCMLSWSIPLDASTPPTPALGRPKLSNEKRAPGWLVWYRGWTTTQLYLGIIISHEIRIPSLTNQDFNGKSPRNAPEMEGILRVVRWWRLTSHSCGYGRRSAKGLVGMDGKGLSCEIARRRSSSPRIIQIPTWKKLGKRTLSCRLCPVSHRSELLWLETNVWEYHYRLQLWL